MKRNNIAGFAALILAAAYNSGAYSAESRCLHVPINEEGIDVFLVAGQSNATGIPDDAVGSPRVPEGLALQYYTGRVSTANDPVGNAQPGSAWPAFGIAYNERTGRRAMFVPASVPASSMTPAGDFFSKGHWNETGKLFDAATIMADEALLAAGPHARFAGVLWDQGEADALAINLKFETPAEYQAALVQMIARLRDHFGSTMPFFIFETGATLDKNQSGFAAVREAQEKVSTENPLDPIVFKSAAGFIQRGLMAKNGAHYTQAGYNIMGKEGAEGVAAFHKHHDSPLCE